MSGVYCEGCWEGTLIPDAGGAGQEPVVCDLCSWRADYRTLSSVSVDGEGEPWTKRERKKAGKLFFLWVTLDPRKDDALFAVMKVLGLESMSSGGGPDALIELGTKPSDEQMAQLAKVQGVLNVRLAP